MKTSLVKVLSVAMALVFVASAAWAAPGEGGKERGGRQGGAQFGGPGPKGDPMGAGQRGQWQDPDTDGDCLISDEEAQAAIDKAADRMREGFSRINDQILNRFDENGDGVLTGAELERAKEAKEEMKKRRGGGAPAGGRMKEILEKFDADGDGVLSPEERQKAKEEMMKQRGGGRGGEDFRKKMLEKFDADGDGQLNQEERQKAKAEMMKQRGGDRRGKDIAE